MNKTEFLSALRERLTGLPPEDIEKSVEYYSEIIEDKIEDGTPENEAVEALGTLDEITSQIIGDAPLSKIIKENVKPKRRLKSWETALIIIGSPIWVTLLFAVGAMVIFLYLALWTVIAGFYLTVIALGIVAVLSFVSSYPFLSTGDFTKGFFLLGLGFFCTGIDILMFVEFTALSKLLIKLSGKIGVGIKRLFVGKGEI